MTGSGTSRPPQALTSKTIEALKPDQAGPYRLPDSRCKGLAVRVARDGGKTWDLTFRVKGAGVKRLSLGRFDDVSLESARERANTLTSAARRGIDHIANEAGARDEHGRSFTVGELINDYVKRRVAGKLKTADDIESRLRRALASVLTRKAADIRRRDLRMLFDETVDQGYESEAEKRRKTVSAMFRWALRQDIIETDPTTGLTPYDEGEPRERVLSADEIAKLWLWLNSGDMYSMSADVLRLQLLLGCRVGEASRMHASEFSKDTKGRLIWTLPMERSKNNKARVTPIVGLAREIVETRLETANDDGRLFVSERGMDLSATLVGQHIRARWDRLPVERFGTHDLRRTAATQMVELGLSLDIVAAIVGHSAGGVQAQTLVKHYVHSDFIDRKAIALASWDARMHTIISDEKSTGAIIPMRRNNS